MTMFFFFKSAFSAAFPLSGLVGTTPPLSSGSVTTFGFPRCHFSKQFCQNKNHWYLLQNQFQVHCLFKEDCLIYLYCSS